nr:hypothetical protein [Tanacetum cinerariifolium]
MVEKSKLDEDREGKVVDPSHYRGMIGTLLYLTASRPDLQFTICVCARTMATTIKQQVALDEALVPNIKRLRIGRRNFRLPLDIQSKESTLQVVYDVLRRSPFFKAFLVTVDVLEIYMQEFWVTTYVHQHSIRFKMDTRKNIVDLEAFWEMLHISPRVPGQSFDELPFEEEILDFLRFLEHMEHKNQKKSNEMYYPRFTKVIIHHFMMKKPSIPRQNKVNWHYVRDDILFLTIKVVSRHQNTQQYGATQPIEFTTEDIRNTKAYKEYYACATGEAVPKPKASARRKRGGSDSSTTPPTAVAYPRTISTVTAAMRLTVAAKGKQPARATGPNDPSEVERTEAEQLKIVLKRRVPDVPSDDSEEEISWNSSDDEDVDDQDKGKDDEGEKNDESDADDDDQDDAEKDDDDEVDDDEEEISKLDEQEDTESGESDAEETESNEESAEEETREKEEESLRVSKEQRIIEEEEAYELYHDVDINQGRGL